MKPTHLIALLAAGFTIGLCPPSMATVETQVFQTLQLQSEPLDMAIAVNGQYIFALLEGGVVEIYGADGKPVGRIEVGPNADRIEAGPREDVLLVKSRADRTVQVLSLEFIQAIDTAGSAFKGPEKAPVEVVVFSDFQ